ncbi:PepSY domain-containing protein [Nanchangia anserum]|uniref:PepSY domain-containing protein n=1 Tax=Nanchangia anserum TaxID=2692125 RepID=A0A8I0KWI1_9ACTO|nr:PepSY domain-containing protein [Nanchangia anserum]MBD3690024.1 PepSY domain-containing protein [Nanchangia anserum]QOX82179.1 PepSY domain-containing protein [Nanchangia anserum]
MTHRRYLPLALTALTCAALGLAGCTQNGAAPRETETVTQTPTAQQEASSSAGHAYAPFADADAVVAAAHAVVADHPGTVIGVDTDNRAHNITVTVREGADEVTYTVAEGGQIRESDRDREDDALPSGLIDLSRALEAARVAGTDYLDDAEIDEDSGRWRWEISVDDADGHDLREVVIDARTGEIITDTTP